MTEPVEMTAEIVLANAQAIVMAADSAVTIAGGKVYNSAIKLFSLSKVQPVGIMVYGSATLMEVPWETLIKMYRKQLQETSFDTVEEYGADFFSFLSKNQGLFSEQRQAAWICGCAYQLACLVREGVSQRQQERDQDRAEAIGREVDELAAFLHDQKLLADASESSIEACQARYGRDIQNIFKEFFPDEQSLPTSVIDKFKRAAAEYIFKQTDFGPDCGIVICGFGDKEIYPAMIEYKTSGFALGILKATREPALKIGEDAQGGFTSSFIRPLAQSEQVYSFMNGISGSLYKEISKTIQGSLDYLEKKFLSLTQEEIEKEIREEKEEMFLVAMESIKNKINENHKLPVMSMLSYLPKEEMADMAESLVNLTVFRRRISSEHESVGGPIDVAVISKGDGLVWVKRKHYFPAELNSPFFQHYQRGV